MEFNKRKEKLVRELNEQLKIMTESMHEIDNCNNDFELIEVMLKRTKELQKINFGSVTDGKFNRKE